MNYGEPGYLFELSIAKNIGLIKYFNAADNTSWELINYEIKK
jgi:hypothetical protein